MLPEVVQVGRLHHAGGHVAVLDALVGENRRSEITAQVHLLQPFHVQLGNGVIALPEGLQIFGRHTSEDSFQPLRPLQKLWQVVHSKAVRVHYHFLRRGNDNAYRGPSFQIRESISASRSAAMPKPSAPTQRLGLALTS